MWQTQLEIKTNGKGLYLINDAVIGAIASGMKKPVGSMGSGLLNIFVQHTSASLIIQENADPTAQADLEEYFERLAPEGESWHRHTHEGPDDTTSHFRAALTQVSLNVPIIEGRLGLGTWQGIYLFEHRRAPHRRKVILTLFIP